MFTTLYICSYDDIHFDGLNILPLTRLSFGGSQGLRSAKGEQNSTPVLMPIGMQKN
jgi:hypothetical protein